MNLVRNNRDEALISANDLAEKLGDAECALGGDIEWDGEEIPALTLWFAELDGVLQPLF